MSINLTNLLFDNKFYFSHFCNKFHTTGLTQLLRHALKFSFLLFKFLSNDDSIACAKVCP